jgi:hypothetical protein
LERFSDGALFEGRMAMKHRVSTLTFFNLMFPSIVLLKSCILAKKKKRAPSKIWIH